MHFDWTKISTIVVYEGALTKVGMDVVCQAHLHHARVLIAGKSNVFLVNNSLFNLFIECCNIMTSHESSGVL